MIKQDEYTFTNRTLIEDTQEDRFQLVISMRCINTVIRYIYYIIGGFV